MSKTIHWYNSSVANLRQQLNDNLLALENNQSSFSEAIKEEEKFAKVKNIYHEWLTSSKELSQIKNRYEDDCVDILVDFFEKTFSMIYTKHNHWKQNARFFESAINERQSNIAFLNEQLSVIKSQTFSLTLEEVKNALKNITTVVQDTIDIYLQNESPYVSWVFDNLLLVPTEITNSIASVVDFGDFEPSIPIGKTLISMGIVNYGITITGLHPNYPYNFVGELVCHPHIMDNNSPCLGDFRDTLYEALDSKDWATACIIIQSFLSHANTRDSIGRNWTSFFFKYLELGDVAVQFAPGKYNIVKRNGESIIHPLCIDFFGLS
jgi:hypothetical protein